jgi:glc operon protein GlcG
MVDGVIVGGVGVSGAASAQQDEELAIAGAAALVGVQGRTAMNPVAYYAAPAVTASFGKGAVLVDDAGGRNYMVHTSRRDKAGQAEVHARDTDIIYVTAGTASLVTGGTVVDGRVTGIEEVRGASITGGETRVIAPGDVIVVPNGTPHWFKTVDGVLNYYVVKVRSEVAAPMPVVPQAGGTR